MFGTEIAAQVIVEELKPLAMARNLTGPVAGPYLPQGYGVIGVVFSPEFSAYDDGRFGRGLDSINHETIRMRVMAGCKGASTDPILDFVEEQIEHLDGNTFTTTYREHPYDLTFTANGEVPITTTYDGAEVHRQLGTVYVIDITRGD